MKRFVTLLVVVAALLCLSASAANTQRSEKTASLIDLRKAKMVTREAKRVARKAKKAAKKAKKAEAEKAAKKAKKAAKKAKKAAKKAKKAAKKAKKAAKKAKKAAKKAKKAAKKDKKIWTSIRKEKRNVVKHVAKEIRESRKINISEKKKIELIKKIQQIRQKNNLTGIQWDKKIQQVVLMVKHFQGRNDLKKFGVNFFSKAPLKQREVQATNPCVKRLPMEGGEMQFDFFNGEGYAVKSVDDVEGHSAIFLGRTENDVNVVSTRCVNGTQYEKDSFVCRLLSSRTCRYKQKDRFSFRAVAQSTGLKRKALCVNVCLQCPGHLATCSNTSKRYFTNVVEMGAEDACADVCDKNIALAQMCDKKTLQQRRKLLQSGDQGC